MQETVRGSVVPSIRRRITATLFLTQSFVSAALIAGFTVHPILGAHLSGAPKLAGLPGTLVILGAAGAAYPAGRLMDRVGRRWGLVAGMGLGAIGALIAGLAAIAGLFTLFLLGLLFVGAARGFADLSRFAAAEVSASAQRGRAISFVVFGGTVGAIGGPALVAPTSAIAQNLGLDPLVGPLLAGTLLFSVAAILLTLLLHPDPRDIARQLAASVPVAERPIPAPRRNLLMVLRLPQARLAVGAMIFGQVVMVLLMSIVGLHMTNHAHGIGDVSLVIMSHTLGMFGLSVVTGPLADRLGRPVLISAGSLTLVAGCLLAPLSLATPLIALALFLIGLGWNMCYIAGSSLLSDLLRPEERGGVQGTSDLVVGLSSAASGLGSGVALATIGFGALSLVGALLALIPLALVLSQRQPANSRTAEA